MCACVCVMLKSVSSMRDSMRENGTKGQARTYHEAGHVITTSVARVKLLPHMSTLAL